MSSRLTKTLSIASVIGAVSLLAILNYARSKENAQLIQQEIKEESTQAILYSRNREQIRILREQVRLLGQTPVTLPPIVVKTEGQGPTGPVGPRGIEGQATVVTVPVVLGNSGSTTTSEPSSPPPSCNTLKVDNLVCLK